MSLSIGSTIATRTYGQHVERIKQAGSNLGKVCMQFQPFDYQRGRFQIAKSGVGLSLPVSRIDRRRPSLHSNGMQSVICAAALNVRCGAATAEQTQTVTQKSPTITHIPGKEKSPRLDDGGSGFPPYDCGGGGGSGGVVVVETFRWVDGSFLVFLVSLAF
ncbi:protein YELLOW LEAF 1, choloroplastic-like [Fagus crenata]